MAILLHARGRAGTETARAWAARLAEALGEQVAPRVEGPADSWRLVAGAAAAVALAADRSRVVVLPRSDPRWSLEDMVKRPLGALPPACRVVVPPGLGEALLLRARPDLVPLRAGGFPAPEETPVLAEGPFDGRPAGDPLDPARFVPAPGTGHALLVPPEGADAPGAVRTLEDPASRAALEIEAAFAEGAGEAAPGAVLGVHARRRAEVLLGLRAVLFLPGEDPRDLAADVPLADRVQFARAFGRHLARR